MGCYTSFQPRQGSQALVQNQLAAVAAVSRIRWFLVNA